ncbi:hypothetical protein LSH36_199g01022 [Paralvinella palmiformis]|uniref:Elongation factor-like 1 n=1 Tax=Paralvinella palmiformis TaxID=53620 RepID=A0AAD9N7L7_9ANNE|nr:hypothetical protein LSH36_199g01022 [Paralvinella palmiformis]
MRTTTLQKLAELQKNPSKIRNICILAHVDHGKTTLADALVASNGIISQRLAGKLRYLDSREDEQIRGITMKSSAIALDYKHGHIDFSSEVSTAVRLCDGAVILVDVVEGICPQTHAVLRQAWLENIKPVLILNKMDRLITELKMTPFEANIHLQHILEQVNAITGELFTSHVLKESSHKSADKKDPETVGEDDVYHWSTGLEDVDDSHIYFSPDQGNVIFASAIDGWGFRIHHFADLYEAKLGFKVEILRKTLWGDFYLDSKTKRIKKGAQDKGKKPLFVQFILDNLWAVYEAVLIKRDTDMIDKIVKSLKLKIQTRDSRQDARVHLQAITSQWLPLSNAVLAMVVECLPSPLEVTEERVEKLLCSNARKFDSLPEQTQQLKDDFLACSSAPEAPVIVYVSKMFSIDWKHLPQNKQRPLTSEEMTRRREIARQRHAERMLVKSQNERIEDTTNDGVNRDDDAAGIQIIQKPKDVEHQPDEQVFIAFARVFSGTVKRGASLYVLGPKHDPALVLEQLEEHDGNVEAVVNNQQHVQQYTVGDLYLFMGKELEAMDEVPAGNILGLSGLENLVLKSATLSSTVACPAFTDMYMEAAPIVRVALEPKNPGNMKQLVEGLRLLNQADPCVCVFIQGTGEHIIMCAGEVHLQKCLDDLKDRYARVDVNVSSPVVPFRETIIPPPKTDMVNEMLEGQTTTVKAQHVMSDEDGSEDSAQQDFIELQTTDRSSTIGVKAIPLPEEVTQLLEKNAAFIKMLELYSSARRKHANLQIGFRISDATLKALREFKANLQLAFSKSGQFWEGAIDQIWSFGPRRDGPNLLLNRIPNYDRPSLWTCLNDESKAVLERFWDFDNSIVSGFQMATQSGPLCEEPMRGVCFILEKWDSDKELYQKERNLSDGQDQALSEETPFLRETRTNSGMFVDDLVETSATWNDSAVVSEGDTGSCSLREASLTKDCVDSEGEHTSNIEGAVDSLTSNMSRLAANDLKVSHEIQPTSVHSITGQLMFCTKEACRKAFQAESQRLMIAMYSSVIQATVEVLGKLYAVLGKRNGRVLQADMKEGSSLFNVRAVLPVIESFGFAEEVRKKTSGLASPQLKFSHWEVIDVDPFWVPTTEEEYLHFGDKADSENQARQYMNAVRRRKGLKVDEKLVEFAEKQRTLSKNK